LTADSARPRAAASALSTSSAALSAIERASSQCMNMSTIAVLERLERRQRDAELLARLEIVERGVVQHQHGAGRFAATAAMPRSSIFSRIGTASPTGPTAASAATTTSSSQRSRRAARRTVG